MTASRSVHPRVRGERASPNILYSASVGSSPRARGTLLGDQIGRPSDRFIPACAGNATPNCWARAGEAVHPRVRGERSPTTRLCNSTAGSSPRARGTRRHAGLLVLRDRFIPACAGNAIVPGSASPASAVHPRVRGEREPMAMITSTLAGSSPRARGTLDGSGDGMPWPRFIPACAGNASAMNVSAAPIAVHPRVRGERFSGPSDPAYGDGSSPRARGTPSHWLPACPTQRFIPACAGNASPRRAFIQRPSVHPRVRGERSATRSDRTRAIGSSPRARGTRW